MSSSYRNRYFMTLNCEEQRKLYKELYISVPPSLISYVKDLSTFDVLSIRNRIRAFRQVDTLLFCLGYLVKENKEYGEFRNFQQHQTETVMSIKMHIEKAISNLNKLKGNKKNIEILNSLVINIPSSQGDYYKEIEDISLNTLKKAGFSKYQLKRNIIPLLRKAYRGQEI